MRAGHTAAIALLASAAAAAFVVWRTDRTVDDVQRTLIAQQRTLDVLLARSAAPRLPVFAAPPPPAERARSAPVAPSEPGPAAHGATDSAPAAAPAPEVQRSFERAQSVLQTAVAARRWSAQARTDFGKEFRTLPQGLAMKLLKQYVVAVNAGELEVDQPGPPF
jgi:hypothetical protein